MTENLRVVFIGEMVASGAPNDILVAYGLGSCVAVCLYDPKAKVGGMLHALLPTVPNGGKARGKPTKFVDQGVPLLIESLLGLGARRARLIAKLCGGAQMASSPGFNGQFNIGQLNVQAAEAALKSVGLRVRAQATGGRAGRTVKLYLADGTVTVRTLKEDEQVLT